MRGWGQMAENVKTAEELRKEIRVVRDSVLGLVTRMEDIKLQQIPQIRADYALKIGCWEQGLLEAEIAARRAKRRLALAQGQANRGVAPRMDHIETVLDIEFAEWSALAEEAHSAVEQALAWRAGLVPMTKAEANILHSVYRTLMKRLHPDVHMGEDEERAALFQIAQAAYKNGDVEALRSLEAATRRFDGPDDLAETDDATLLAEELELAQIEENVMRQQLHKLEEGEDIKLGHMLADPDWVAERTMELKAAIEQWERMRYECDTRLEKLKRSFDE